MFHIITQTHVFSKYINAFNTYGLFNKNTAASSEVSHQSSIIVLCSLWASVQALLAHMHVSALAPSPTVILVDNTLQVAARIWVSPSHNVNSLKQSPARKWQVPHTPFFSSGFLFSSLTLEWAVFLLARTQTFS